MPLDEEEILQLKKSPDRRSLKDSVSLIGLNGTVEEIVFVFASNNYRRMNYLKSFEK